MKIKVSETTKVQLDWLVAKIKNPEWWDEFDMESDPLFALEMDDNTTYSPSSNWAQGGPIIEREGISVRLWIDQGWCAYNEPEGMDGESDSYVGCSGPTPLIAAMRCYVASKMGDEVEIPEELV